ncbi:hypothetical protein ACIBG7_40505 [Nonomuraea sp. NPDC050328]|uniref:hypothetical protein n=1 Tax=Nonomuraea sp. NPDC050328 TaxID=3364361 RepID=UPI003791FBA3
MTTAPTQADIEAQFTGLLDGTITREDANRWAARWVNADKPGVDDELVWWGLMHLYGIDLRPGPGEPYLSSDEQIAEWLEEFRGNGKNLLFDDES